MKVLWWTFLLLVNGTGMYRSLIVHPESLLAIKILTVFGTFASILMLVSILNSDEENLTEDEVKMKKDRQLFVEHFGKKKDPFRKLEENIIQTRNEEGTAKR